MRIISVIFVLLLSACGGGASSSSSSILTTFTEINNVLNLPIPYSQSEVTVTQSIDINHDGKDDIVLHFWSKELVNGTIETTVTPNKLLLLIQQSDGTFIDQTSTYLIGSNDLGGISSSSIVSDFNKDGHLDIAYAVSQENGRNSSNKNNMTAQMAALVSVGDKYTITKFGVPDWYNSVGTVQDDIGNVYVVGNGWTNHNGIMIAYSFDSNGVANATNLPLPYISPGAFTFLSSNILIEGNDIDSRVADIHAYVKTNGIWSKVDSYQPANIQGYMNLTEWNGNTATGDPVYNINGTNATMHMNGSCTLKLNPTSENIVLFWYEGLQFNNFTNNMFAVELNTPIYNSFIGVTFDGNKIVKSTINIPANNLEMSNMECKDLNHDGYDDIVLYSLSKNGLPLIYLNDHNGNFTPVNQSQLPNDTTVTINNYNSLLHDFNNDGLIDLLVLPVDYSSNTSVNYKFYRGNVVLK